MRQRIAVYLSKVNEQNSLSIYPSVMSETTVNTNSESQCRRENLGCPNVRIEIPSPAKRGIMGIYKCFLHVRT